MSDGRHGRWAVFLDRDGTLLHLVPYLKDTAQARLYHGVGDALRRLQDAGARLVVVTNQSGVARGLMTKGDVAGLHRRLRALLAECGVKLDRIEVCFDHPDFNGGCECRKPRPGMIFKAARELGVDLGESWTIGDNASDIEAGVAAGTRTALVLTGYGRRTREGNAGKKADVVSATVSAAADSILRQRKAASRPVSAS
jgi:histidinol-phosphate phosphatase family protein